MGTGDGTNNAAVMIFLISGAALLLLGLYLIVSLLRRPARGVPSSLTAMAVVLFVVALCAFTAAST